MYQGSKTIFVAGMALSTILAAFAAAASPEDFWGQWRGPQGTGIASQAKPPTEWSESRNLRWKCKLPGEGASTPVVWGDMVFLQAAVTGGTAASAPAGEPVRDEGRGRRSQAPKISRFTVIAIDRNTGKFLWERVVREEAPHEGHHPDGTFASGSPMTDGEHVYAFFGSRGLYCLTMKGEVVWKKDFGHMQVRNEFGEGSSPSMHGDTVIVNWDHQKGSFIVALDKKTGEEKWKQNRDEETSWSTPLILTDTTPPQVVVSATTRVRSYDINTGKIVWECGGLGINCIASPVAGAGMLFAMSGHRDAALLAIKYAGASGDITGSDAVAWRLNAGTPYVPSPLLYGDLLYFAQKNDGILSCHNARTGEAYYSRQRLDEIKGIYPSPVGADGRVYVLGRNGATYVLKQSPKFEVIAVNKLDDRFTASPALVGGEIFLRGHSSLYCIAEK